MTSKSDFLIIGAGGSMNTVNFEKTSLCVEHDYEQQHTSTRLWSARVNK